MKIVPAIDLRGGATVRLVEGSRDAETRYDLDPVEAAQAFERDGALLLHLVNLDGAFGASSTANSSVIRSIVAAVGIPVELGGGLRTEPAVEAAFDVGASWAILGTAAVEDLELVKRLASRFPRRVIVGIDARDGIVATHGWTSATTVDAIELGRRVAAVGIERVIYTDISRDGRLAGANVEATARLARETGLRVTASGGIGTLDDVRRVKAVEADGVDACIIGKALYEKRFTLRDAIEAGLAG